mmetsp:Transcript_53601/g.61440  ORF Transcript_53601/g.61440 Transcript_53601/m.61440 type:complete len:98 (+) Transcript_53601:1586-1879(+)
MKESTTIFSTNSVKTEDTLISNQGQKFRTQLTVSSNPNSLVQKRPDRLIFKFAFRFAILFFCFFLFDLPPLGMLMVEILISASKKCTLWNLKVIKDC